MSFATFTSPLLHHRSILDEPAACRIPIKSVPSIHLYIQNNSEHCWTHFHEILYPEVLLKSIDTFQCCLKSYKNNRHLTWRSICVSAGILNLLHKYLSER
jgi:hypothetical protein